MQHKLSNVITGKHRSPLLLNPCQINSPHVNSCQLSFSDGINMMDPSTKSSNVITGKHRSPLLLNPCQINSPHVNSCQLPLGRFTPSGVPGAMHHSRIGTIPVHISTRTPRRTNALQRNSSNLTNIKLLPPSPPSQSSSISFRCLNARNLKNKTSNFIQHISEHRPDIVAITETWLTTRDAAARVECTPPGYKLLDQSRTTPRHGGGTALLIRDCFTTKRISSCKQSSFEFCDWSVSTKKRTSASLSSTDHHTLRIILSPSRPSWKNSLLFLKPSPSAKSH